MSEDDYDEREDDEKCATCHGTGVVNTLTNPNWAPFVASWGDCPVCDGTGTTQ